MTQLLVASRNRKKLAELSRVLEHAGVSGVQLVSLDEVPPYPEAPETAATFEENALAKARDGYAAGDSAGWDDNRGGEDPGAVAKEVGCGTPESL